MALTVEEKLNRLSNMEDWEIYPPEHKAFLTSVANNIEPAVAFVRAYPTSKKNPGFGAGGFLLRTNIRKALDVIQYVKPVPVYTKREALEDITQRIRKQGVEDETYIKLLSLLAKMSGWDKPKKEEEKEEEKSPLELVLDEERKRREEA